MSDQTVIDLGVKENTSEAMPVAEKSVKMPVYMFLDKAFTDIPSLVFAMAENWEEGKKQLFRGTITEHFKSFDRDLAWKCQAAQEEAETENGKDDIIFFRLLYQLNPVMKAFCWMGQIYESLETFGKDVLDKLWDSDESQFAYYESILAYKALSVFVNQTDSENETLKKAVDAIEESFETEQINGTDLRRTYYLMAYMLSGEKLLLLNGEQFRTVGEFAGYMKSVLDESFAKFESVCHKLVDYDGNLDHQLETWLICIGKQKELEEWRASMN